MDDNQHLFCINKNLASRGIKLRIEKRGQKLNLRGPLPRKDGPGALKVQRISLNIKNDENAISEAGRIAELIAFQIEHNQFNWENWSRERSSNDSKHKESNLEDSLEDFKKTFFEDKSKSKSPSSKKTTWQSAYKPYINRLLKTERETNYPVGKELFLEVLFSYKENSRSRQQCSIVIGSLAKHLGLELPENWKAISSGYGINQSRYRELPSDDLIKEIFKKIPNPKWRFVFGLMATYGLRNHEVFYSDLSCLNKNSDRILRVFPTTKTGEHQVWPFHPEWVEEFGLDNIDKNINPLPNINTDLNSTTLQKVGRRVTEQFKRYNLLITPYDLRHAWAIRTIHIGLPNTVSARMMGHSVSIHTKTYHHWITRRDQQLAVDTALSKQKIS